MKRKHVEKSHFLCPVHTMREHPCDNTLHSATLSCGRVSQEKNAVFCLDALCDPSQFPPVEEYQGDVAGELSHSVYTL